MPVIREALLVTKLARKLEQAGLVSYGHSKGVRMGWYLNGCACGEHVELFKNYEGDIRSLHEFGFDVSTHGDSVELVKI